MIIVKNPEATSDNIGHIVEKLKAHGLEDSENALSDGPQSLTFNTFKKLFREMQSLIALCRRIPCE